MVGMLYAETEVLRKGNNQLLDDLKDSVVIFDEKKNIVYYNISTPVNKKSQCSMMDEDSEQGVKLQLAEMIQEKEMPQFAHIDKLIFKDLNVDT